MKISDKYSTKNKSLRLSAPKRQKNTYNLQAAWAARGIIRGNPQSRPMSPEPNENNTAESYEGSSGLQQTTQNVSKYSGNVHERLLTTYSEQLITPVIDSNRLIDPDIIETSPLQTGSMERVPKSRSDPRPKHLNLSHKRLTRRINVGVVNWRISRNLMGRSNDADPSNSQTPNTKDVYEFRETQEGCTENVSGENPCNIGGVPPEIHAEEEEVSRFQLVVEPGPSDPTRDEEIDAIKGRYIVDGQHFLRAMRGLENHRFQCLKSKNGYFKLKSSEEKALVWSLRFECPECGIETTITSDPTPDKLSSSDWSVCDSAVWGTLASGGGHSNMVDLFSTIGIKPIDQKTSTKKENRLGEVWQKILSDAIMQAGKEEKELALQRGDVNESGVPFITVIVDGGWSHRSHGHRYTSQSGVACVIGQTTKKLLHVDMRNKYCSKCMYLQAKSLPVGHEGCCKNWNGTSQAMEADMFVQAFRQSVEIHGLEYRCVIGDGDSSVYAKLREMVPYGLYIQKSECANHAVKNYCKALFNQKSLPGGVRSILNKTTVLKLKKDARYAIYHVAETSRNAEDLREDLLNGPAHVLGIHTNCKAYYCKHTDNENELSGLRLVAYNFAKECMKPLLRKASRLVLNDTSNLAENLMSLVAKHSGGKQVNHCKRSSWNTRVNVAGLAYQFGSMWTHTAMKITTGKSPADIIKKVALKKIRRKEQSKESVIRRGQLRTKLRYTATSPMNEVSAQPDTIVAAQASGHQDYGPMCVDLDMEMEDYIQAATCFTKNLQVDNRTREEIERLTRGQHTNELWFLERRHRLTASRFGEICKRRKNTKSGKLVSSLLYPKKFTNNAVVYGSLNESNAKEAYAQLYPTKKLQECGLFVHATHGFLAASPDCLIDDDGILEVKCPKSAERITFEEAVSSLKGFCLNKDGKLKRNHNYFYQMQGQLEIADRQYCDFVVYSPKFVHVERIERDREFWECDMLPKLKLFFENALLPELVDPRRCRSMPLRDT